MSCGGNCGSCGSSSGCGTQAKQVQDLRFSTHELSSIKHVVAVMSGKGGVGKSTVTALLAISMARRGYKVGILDADITGPSIPKMFGLSGKVHADELGMYPMKTKGGIDVMSINLVLDDPKSPVVWRGPIIANVVQQFYSDIIWKDLDYLFVDMPPGTGDVPLTVLQSMPVDGVVMVTSPQDVVAKVVEKSIGMTDIMAVPIIGIVENMSYFVAPDTGKVYHVFGESHIEDVVRAHDLLLLGRLPLNPTQSLLADEGRLEDIEKTGLETVSLPE